jgi:hypothetical protein
MTDPNLHSTQNHLETYSHLRQEDPSQSSEEYLEEKYRELTEKLRNAWNSYQTSKGLKATRLRTRYLVTAAKRDQIIQVYHELQRLGKIPPEKELPSPEELLSESCA